MPLVLDGDLQVLNEFDGDITLDIYEEDDITLNIYQDGEGGIFMAISSQQWNTYTGDYVIIPKVTEQILLTQDKLMTDDVTVTKVPYYETSNPSGGKTVYIASELGG